MKEFGLGLGLSFALALSALQPAWADRVPTAEEKTRIEAALRTGGFQRWEEIEFDDDGWEVEGAVAADNVAYDVKIDAQSFAILEREAAKDD